MPALPLVPMPEAIRMRKGTCRAGRGSRILVDTPSPEFRAVAKRLREALPGPGSVPVRLALDPSHPGEEGYRLSIAPDEVRLSAAAPAGLFYAVQTLRQLGPGPLPCLELSDRPRFPWRGLLLDTCRHFFPVGFLKRQIDLLAFHKMNRLHWHLTEDQGWRIRIDAFPELTRVGSWRATVDLVNPDRPKPVIPGIRYGGFYTKAEVREVVAYAAERHVMVVPEIEMPGHSLAALAAYPELSCTGGPFEVATKWGIHEDVYCAGNEKTFRFLETVLDEVLDLFPSPFIHIGGDECPKARWKACPKCQARIRRHGLKDEHELQSWFIQRMVDFLASRGRRAIGWDEILEGGLAKGATVQSWRGMKGAVAAARAGHDVLASPYSHTYLNMRQLTLRTCHAFDPVPPQLTKRQARHVLGGEAALWTEFADPLNAERQLYPRLSALAEAFWSEAPRNWGVFRRRLRIHARRLRDLPGASHFDSPMA